MTLSKAKGMSGAERTRLVDAAGRSVKTQLGAVAKAEKAVMVAAGGTDGANLRKLFRARERLATAENYARSLFTDDEIGA